MDTFLKRQIEALLFSSGRKMSVDEIVDVCKAEKKDVAEVLLELKDEYNNRDSALKIVDEGEFWKINVREQHLGVVQSIVTETEMGKAVTETLAVIAFKNPAMQADIIKIRGNKAYEHMAELLELGYLTKEKFGRTFKIKLTQQFFNYFDLPPDKIQEEFKDFKELEKAIEEKEAELEEKIEERTRVTEVFRAQIQQDQEIEKKLDAGELELDDEYDQEQSDNELAQDNKSIETETPQEETESIEKETELEAPQENELVEEGQEMEKLTDSEDIVAPSEIDETK